METERLSLKKDIIDLNVKLEMKNEEIKGHEKELSIKDNKISTDIFFIRSAPFG